MEIFVDGGLFEIILASVFAAAINFVFRRKMLLIAYAVVLVTAPLVLLFTANKEVLYTVVAFAVINHLLLAIVLLREHNRNPGAPLFKMWKK
jgi:hypothetical protein